MFTLKKHNNVGRKSEIESIKEEHLRGRLFGCVIDVFDNYFGDDGREGILLCLKEQNVTLNDVIRNPEKFNDGLEKLLGPEGTNFVIRRIAEKVFFEFGLASN